MNKLNSTHFLMALFSVLVVKSLFLGPLSMGEALVGVALVGYSAFMKYMEHKKGQEVTANFEDRIKNLESKLSFMTSGGRMMNRNNSNG